MSEALQRYMTGSDALGFEKKLWEAADKLRSNMDAAVYKHVVLGLIFLKYISDAFDELFEALKADPEADEEDEDEYIAQKVFWVPKAARWINLKDNARQPEIGQIIDDAMRAIENRNLALKGVLPKDYARPDLDKVKLGELVDLIGGIGLGDKENQSKDILGRVYEYFLGQFASAEGKKGGQFYTPRSIVKLLVEMLRPFKGRIYDPCCGSGGMFVQSDLFIKEHGGKIQDLAIYGQESNPTTWRLFKMNLALRKIAANVGPEPADTFGKDLHPDLRADYIIANPPFNIKDWGQPNLLDDPRWVYGVPPKKNANFGWVQHIIHHLSSNGMAGFVLANGSLSSNTNDEGGIRRAIIEADMLDCVVALPDRLFFNTGIPACLWFVVKNKADRKFRDRRGETLFIDCRRMGKMISATQRELSDELLDQISDKYMAWRGDEDHDQEYEDEAGFCKATDIDGIKDQGFIITPGRYVDAPLIENDDEPFEDKITRLSAELKKHFAESSRLEGHIRENLEGLGFDI